MLNARCAARRGSPQIQTAPECCTGAKVRPLTRLAAL